MRRCLKFLNFVLPGAGFVAFLATSQQPLEAVDFNRVIQILKQRPIDSKCERTLARLETRIERDWWKKAPHFVDAADLREAHQRGEIEPLRAIKGVRYSSNMIIRFGRPEAFDTLDRLAQDFRSELARQRLDPLKVDLIVTSLIRTLDYQQHLIRLGRPAAIKSSHTQGLAIDISYSWLAQNEPRYAYALRSVLRRWASQGLINVVQERQQGVWHIGLSPKLFNP